MICFLAGDLIDGIIRFYTGSIRKLHTPDHIALTLLVILINGWTDAPNAIATAVSTKSITPKKAVILAAVFNFLGVLFMTMLNATVAQTIYKMVDFRGDASAAISALCAGMVGILIWAVAAWAFGIPTSESHALIAGISGAAIALQGGFSGINGSEWVKVIYGLLISSVLGFGSGLGVVKLIEAICMKMDRRKTGRFFRKAQVGGAAAMAFMHGAQDGQKFMGVFLLGVALAQGNAGQTVFEIPIWLMVLCSIVMGLGLQSAVQNHQNGRHGHGETSGIPGIRNRSRRDGLPALPRSWAFP